MIIALAIIKLVYKFIKSYFLPITPPLKGNGKVLFVAAPSIKIQFEFFVKIPACFKKFKYLMAVVAMLSQYLFKNSFLFCRTGVKDHLCALVTALVSS